MLDKMRDMMLYAGIFICVAASGAICLLAAFWPLIIPILIILCLLKYLL